MIVNYEFNYSLNDFIVSVSLQLSSDNQTSNLIRDSPKVNASHFSPPLSSGIVNIIIYFITL
jgi:hypothetical protein